MRLTVQLAAIAAVMVWGVSGAQGEQIVRSEVISDKAVMDGAVVDGAVVGGATVAADGTVVAGPLGGGMVGAAGRTVYGQPDLFYNFYTQGYANVVNAQMYVAPLPVPPWVGHTYYTYQPFMPHEMLYWHKDRFHNHYDNGRGLNRTRATYYAPPVRTAVSGIYFNYIRLPR